MLKKQKPGIEPGFCLSGAIRRGNVCSVRPRVPWGQQGVKDERFPQFSVPAPWGRRQKIGSPTRRLRRSHGDP